MNVVASLVGFTRGRELLILSGVIALLLLGGLALDSRVRSLDEIAFHELATNIAERGEFAQVDYRSNVAPEPGQEPVPTAYRAPGYPAFLALFAWAGDGIRAMRWGGVLLFGASLLTLFSCLRRLHSDRAGLVGALMVLGCPAILYCVTVLYPQTLASLLLLLVFRGALELGPRAGHLRFAVNGLVFGALILTTPIFLLTLPIYVIWLLTAGRAPWRHVGVFAISVALTVGSWTARNAVAFGEFVPVATSAGFNFASGNCDEARYNTSLDVRWDESVYTELTGKGEVESNRILVEAGLDWIAEDPGRAALLYVQKFAHWFAYSNTLLSDTAVEGGATSMSSRVREWALLLSYGGLVFLLLCRIVFSKLAPWNRYDLLAALFYVALGLAYALFFTRVRFRIPVDWLLICTVAPFVAAVLDRFTARLDDPTTAAPVAAERM